jgi:hypothetical protein
MRFKNISLIWVAAVGIFTAACTKKEQLGPEIKSASKDFKFSQNLTVTKTQFINLTDKPNFEAQFNEEVSWKLRLIGLTSGAVQEFNGLSKGFDANTINWDARSTNIFFFRLNENVATELTITGIREKFYGDTFLMRYVVPYHNQVINGVKHIVIDNFDQDLAAPSPVNCLDILGKGKSTDRADIDIDFDRYTNRSVYGVGSYKFTGRDVNRNSWSGDIYSDFIFNFYRNASSVANLRIDSGIDPKDLYFNIFVYGNGSNSAGIQLKVYEIDSKPGGSTDTITNRQQMHWFATKKIPASNDPANAYFQNENDGWIYNITVNWQGWKLVSIPYSEFKSAPDPLAGGNGDRKKESWRICGASLSLLSEPPGNLNEVYVDMFTITQNGRFQF